MSSKLCVVCHQQGARPLRRDEYPFEIFRIALDFDLQLNTHFPCRTLRFLYILRCVRTGLANQKHNLSKLWKQLSDHLQSLRYNVGANAGHSGDVVVGPGETRDEPCCHRVYGGHEDHWDFGRSVPRRQHRRSSRGDNNVYSATYQLPCRIRDLSHAFCQAVLDDEVLAFAIAQLAQSLPEAFYESRRWRSNAQETDPPDLPRLLS